MRAFWLSTGVTRTRYSLCAAPVPQSMGMGLRHCQVEQAAGFRGSQLQLRDHAARQGAARGEHLTVGAEDHYHLLRSQQLRRQSIVHEQGLTVHGDVVLAILIELCLKLALGSIAVQEDLRGTVEAAAEDHDDQAHDCQIPQSHAYAHALSRPNVEL